MFGAPSGRILSEAKDLVLSAWYEEIPRALPSGYAPVGKKLRRALRATICISRQELISFCRDSKNCDRNYPERSEGSRRTGIKLCVKILRLAPQDSFCRETRQKLIMLKRDAVYASVTRSRHHDLPAYRGLQLLVGFNAIFVAAEFAIVKVRRTRLEELAGQGLASARISLLCVDQLDQTLSATQLGITLMSLGLGWIGESAFSSCLRLLYPDFFLAAHGAHHVITVGLSFFIVTALHVVLGELVPKNMAIQDAERITLLLAGPLRLFYVTARPLLFGFTRVANFILRRLGFNNFEEEPFTEQELKLVMKESKEDGIISDSEAQIITRAFEFADKRVVDIMVAKDQVDFISLSRPLDQNLAVVRKNMHTRFPVCKGEFGEALGIIHMKDVWPTLLTKFSNEAFEKTLRPPIFVASHLRQDQLMKLFQSCRAHMAIVRDAEGNNLGIVTLEDILEGLVGEIRDEHGN